MVAVVKNTFKWNILRQQGLYFLFLKEKKSSYRKYRKMRLATETFRTMYENKCSYISSVHYDLVLMAINLNNKTRLHYVAT